MELLQLRYFLTAAEFQHMTKAAEHLQIAQPALSQAIRRLETELGVPLFERKSRSIELNEAGRLLQKRLLPILSALDRIPEEIKEGQYQTTHTIHLKLLAASSLITNRIIAYRALRPDVNFQLYQSDSHTDYDLCVSAKRTDWAAEEFSDYMVMLEEDLYLAVPSHSPYGDKDSICLADTRDSGYICLAGSRPIRKICNSYFSEAGFTPRIIFESDTTESVRNLIAAGLGIGFWPQYSWGPLTSEWGPLSSRSSVKLLPIKDQVCRRQIVSMCSPHGRENPIVMDFCNFLIQNSRWL
ncbi:MAG: LysR family transcriptional regulator [Enterocloster sp.]